MKQEELLKLVTNELFNADTLHQEYQDNDTHIVIDLQKEGDTLNIQIKKSENIDKKEFEKWIDNMEDDFFTEVWEELSEENDSLSSLYDSPNYKEVIDKFKEKAREVASRKIEKFQKYLD